MSNLRKITFDLAPVLKIKIDDQPEIIKQLVGETFELNICICGNTHFDHISELNYDASYCIKCNRHYDEDGEELQTI